MKKHFPLFLKGFQLPEINSFLLRNALIKNLSKFIQCAVILTNRKSGWILTEPYYVLLSYYLFAAFVFVFQWNRLLIETLNLFCIVEYQLVHVASLSNACAELLVWNIWEFVLMRTLVGVDHQKFDTRSTLIFVCKNCLR